MFKVQQFVNHPLTWWNSERNNIDMSPVYQRKGGLWSNYDKAYLIDSVLNEFDIPKIYIADFTLGRNILNVAKRPYAVVDGKQRFEAIFDFFDGKVQLNGDFTYFRDPTLSLANLDYRKLAHNHPEIAAKFSEFILAVVSVITDEDGRIEDLFVRLNRSSLALTGAEVRNAMTGIVPELIRDIAGHRFFADCTRFPTARGQDLNAATKILLVEYLGRFTDTKKAQLDSFVKSVQASHTAEAMDAAKRVASTLDIMCDVFQSRDPLLASSGSVILYYWLIRNTAPLDINTLRDSIEQFDRNRKVNRDLVMNNPQEADPYLLQYDRLSRSANDQKSLELRYEMLQEQLQSPTKMENT